MVSAHRFQATEHSGRPLVLCQKLGRSLVREGYLVRSHLVLGESSDKTARPNPRIDNGLFAKATKLKTLELRMGDSGSRQGSGHFRGHLKGASRSERGSTVLSMSQWFAVNALQRHKQRMTGIGSRKDGSRYSHRESMAVP